MLAGVLRKFYKIPSLFSTLCLLQGESESVSHSAVTLCDPMTAALQAPESVGFSRQEYCNRLPFRRSSHPRDRTWVSHFAGRFFTV